MQDPEPHQEHRVTDSRKFNPDDVPALTNEELAELRAEEERRRVARQEMEEELRRQDEVHPSGYDLPPPPGMPQDGEELGPESDGAEPPPVGVRKVHTAFLVVYDQQGNLGCEADVTQILELDRTANMGDFFQAASQIVSELQAEKTSDKMLMKIGMMQQQAQQQADAVLQARAAGFDVPMPPGMQGPPVATNRQQRRHPGR